MSVLYIFCGSDASRQDCISGSRFMLEPRRSLMHSLLAHSPQAALRLTTDLVLSLQGAYATAALAALLRDAVRLSREADTEVHDALRPAVRQAYIAP